VRGVKSLVERAVEARVELNISGRFTDFQQEVPVTILDEEMQPIEGLQITPDSVRVTVPVRRTFFTRKVAVQASIASDTVTTGYQVTEVSVNPADVTLIGERSAVEAAGDFLVTAPITLTNVYDHITSDVALLLPAGVSALNEQEETVTHVRAEISVQPLSDYLVLSRRPALVGLPPEMTVELTPREVSVLLIGPQPLLREIRAAPDLVLLTLDLEGFSPGTYVQTPIVDAPADLNVEIFPPEVQVTLELQ
jgi:YbbR domain-containing protein